jgi:hypothetical protein
VIGQIQGYMGDLMESSTEAVRGILVAGEFSPRVIAAARAASNLILLKYAFRFSFETISLGTAQNRGADPPGLPVAPPETDD